MGLASDTSWVHRLTHGHFSPEGDHELSDPEGTNLDAHLMVMLDEARHDAGVPFIATSGVRLEAENARAGGAKDSAHLIDPRTRRACAVDGFLVGWPLLDQFIHLSRYPFFGLGMYPYAPPGRAPSRPWTPVVHVDRKDRGSRFSAKLLWIRNRAGEYVYWPSPDFRHELRALARLEGAGGLT
jgi:hypothetical protein